MAIMKSYSPTIGMLVHYNENIGYTFVYRLDIDTATFYSDYFKGDVIDFFKETDMSKSYNYAAKMLLSHHVIKHIKLTTYTLRSIQRQATDQDEMAAFIKVSTALYEKQGHYNESFSIIQNMADHKLFDTELSNANALNPFN